MYSMMRRGLVNLHKEVTFDELLVDCEKLLDTLRVITVMSKHPLKLYRATKFIVLRIVKHPHVKTRFI
jgi:hypothetical protein